MGHCFLPGLAGAVPVLLRCHRAIEGRDEANPCHCMGCARLLL